MFLWVSNNLFYICPEFSCLVLNYRSSPTLYGFFSNDIFQRLGHNSPAPPPIQCNWCNYNDYLYVIFQLWPKNSFVCPYTQPQ